LHRDTPLLLSQKKLISYAKKTSLFDHHHASSLCSVFLFFFFFEGLDGADGVLLAPSCVLVAAAG
jgi:hypothetical protein